MLDVEDFHAEKYIETINYESGKVDKHYEILFDYYIIQNRAVDSSIRINLSLYDDSGHLIEDNVSNCKYEDIVYSDVGDSEYTAFVSKEAFEKIDTLEITFYRISDGKKLYNITTKIQKGENKFSNINDVPPEYHGPGKYPTQSMYEYSKEQDYYWGHDKFGHEVKIPINRSYVI